MAVHRDDFSQKRRLFQNTSKCAQRLPAHCWREEGAQQRSNDHLFSCSSNCPLHLCRPTAHCMFASSPSDPPSLPSPLDTNLYTPCTVATVPLGYDPCCSLAPAAFLLSPSTRPVCPWRVYLKHLPQPERPPHPLLVVVLRADRRPEQLPQSSCHGQKQRVKKGVSEPCTTSSTLASLASPSRRLRASRYLRAISIAASTRAGGHDVSCHTYTEHLPARIASILQPPHA